MLFRSFGYQWRKDGNGISGATNSAYTLNALKVADAGNYSVVVNNAYGSVTSSIVTLTVNKATPTISVAPTASGITYGQTLANSTLSGGTASVGGSFAFTSPSTAPNAGTMSQGVTFTPTDTANYNTATTTVNVTVAKAAATFTLAGLNQAYDGTAKNVVVTLSPSTLPTTVTYNGSTSVPTNAGSYTVVATVNDANYEGSATDTLVITKI